MRRLSAADAYFLFTERPGWPMHTGSLVILDRTESPGYGVEQVRRLLSERLPRLPEFMMKLKEVPFGLDRPLLVEDEDFNLDYHLHRIAVPSPGGPREVGDLVGNLTQIPLDRRRPLWEMWFIEGLADDRVALFVKVHHCLVDGVSGAGLAELLCDLTPNPPPENTESPQPLERSGRVPATVELAVRGLGAAATSPFRMADWAAGQARRGFYTWRVAKPQGWRTILDAAPKVPWNGVIGPLRRFAYTSVPLAEIKRVREHFGCKVNDVILTLCASTLRGYLLARDVLPAQSLIAVVPMSLRTEGDVELGNKIMEMFVSIHTDIADPVARLAAISTDMGNAKEIGRAIGAKELRSLASSVVPGLANLAWRAYQSLEMEEWGRIPANAVISNVPGAPIPLYTAGARIERLHPVPPVVLSQGLNITVMSYLDSIDVGFTVDREMVPDPWEMVEGFHAALTELVAATGS